MVTPPDKPATTRQHIARRIRALGRNIGLFRKTNERAASDDTPGQPPVISPEEQQRLAAIARDSAPVIWLLGKTGAGKTSVIAALTGDGHDRIGNGYQPCTRTSQLYDFPAGTPLIRFLDTRGLDEAGYDPTEDLAWHQSQAHLIMVVMRLDDPAQDNVIKALAAARKAQPRWPVVVLHTALHDLYPANGDHPASYPFSGGDDDMANPAIPAPLRNALTYQRKLFRGIKGAPPVFVAVDFTREAEGFIPADYGREALIDALLATAPEALRLLVQLKLRQQGQTSSSDLAPQLNTRILYWAAAASAVGAAPVVGLATVPATQLAMLAQLGKAYGITWDRKHLAALLGMLGVAIVTTQGSLLALRQLAKLGAWLIPVAAAQDYAATYALGRAACVYLEAGRNNSKADAEQVKAVFLSSLKQAFSATGRKSGDGGKGDGEKGGGEKGNGKKVP
ncbi:MAG: GTP-binding DUF697 domain-containing protein [Bacteroidales bacterium]|nr:GTP-binding DUF697 domain-containing protein [Bacteroidales bacterium]